jgi:hypothetical protein
MTKRLATGRKRSRGHVDVLAISKAAERPFCEEKEKKKK